LRQLVRKAISRGCVVPKPDTIIISRAITCSGMRRKPACREDNRRITNGEQSRRVAHLAMKRGPSVDLSGYWQRHVKVG
jgi:hypothetical protein